MPISGQSHPLLSFLLASLLCPLLGSWLLLVASLSHDLLYLSICSEKQLPLVMGPLCLWSSLFLSTPLHGAAPQLCPQEFWEAELMSMDGTILKGVSSCKMERCAFTALQPPQE